MGDGGSQAHLRQNNQPHSPRSSLSLAIAGHEQLRRGFSPTQFFCVARQTADRDFRHPSNSASTEIVMATGRERINQIIDSLVSNFSFIIITAIVGFIINWMTQGELILFLHGITQEDMKFYAKTDDLKLYVTFGSWSGKGQLNDNGTYSASVSQDACHEGTLISAYCSPDTPALAKGASGQITVAGLSNGTDHCQWDNIKKPDLFTAEAQAVCLTVSAKNSPDRLPRTHLQTHPRIPDFHS